MIKGYESLNESILKTTELIATISEASKEQRAGIEQINDAVTQLDQQTQQNAQVATQTQQVATSTLTISQTIVNNANAKEFTGKNDVKAKSIEVNQRIKESVEVVEQKSTHEKNDASKLVKNVKVEQANKQAQGSIKEIVSNVDDDEWTSF